MAPKYTLTADRPQKRPRRRRTVVSPESAAQALPPNLREDFGNFVPQRQPTGHRQYMSKDQRRYILWRRAEGEPVPQIADALSIPEKTVRHYLERASKDTSLFADCLFIMRVNLGTTRQDRWWVCRFCNQMNRDKGAVSKHAYGHIFDLEAALAEARRTARIKPLVRH